MPRSASATSSSSGADAGAGIDDEKQQVGLVDGAVWIWRSTSVGEVIDVLDADAAGVDEFEVAVAEPGPGP